MPFFGINLGVLVFICGVNNNNNNPNLGLRGTLGHFVTMSLLFLNSRSTILRLKLKQVRLNGNEDDSLLDPAVALTCRAILAARRFLLRNDVSAHTILLISLLGTRVSIMNAEDLLVF